MSTKIMSQATKTHSHGNVATLNPPQQNLAGDFLCQNVLAANLWNVSTLSDVRISGIDPTEANIRLVITTLTEEIESAVIYDNRNYIKLAESMIDEAVKHLSAKEYFGLIVAMAYESTAGDYKHSEGKMLYKECMYSLLCQHPMSLIQEAFKEHCRTATVRPTPCHILRRIEGYEGVWDATAQERKGKISGLKQSIELKLHKLKKLLKNAT